MSASEELRRADYIAAGLGRGLHVEQISWAELLALAQQELGKGQLKRQVETADYLYSETEAAPLIAAARIINEVARHRANPGNLPVGNGTEDEIDRDESRLLILLSACAFAMYGNFPSAAATMRSFHLEALQSEAEILAAALSNPKAIAQVLQSPLLSDAGADFLERLNLFLVGGDISDHDLMSRFEHLMQMPRDPVDVVFMRCSRLSLKHITLLATANLLKTSSGAILRGFINGVIGDGRVCLLPPQRTLIRQNVLVEGQNSIITIPTSTGKTLIAELIIAARLTQPGDVAVYVVPYIALGRQVYDCLLKHAPSFVDIRGYFGNFNPSIGAINPMLNTVIIATPERLDAILRSNDLYSSITTIIIDEAHSIENGVRGARLEGIIARLRLQQRNDETRFRIVLLSAVLTDVDLVRRWLGENAVHFHDSWRPTARRIAFWFSEGHLVWLYGSDPLRPEHKAAGEYFGWRMLPWPQFMQPAEHFGAVNAQRPAAFTNAAYLARTLQASIGGPILVACGTKAATRGLANTLAGEIPDRLAVPKRVEELGQTIRKKYPHLMTLATMLSRGVAYHNASLPMEIRNGIEDAIKCREIDFVAATTTLAEGVDLPFRITIVFDWLLGAGEYQAPMSPLLFRNIAGRCGRAGEFTEGDTVVFDNMLGSFRYTSHQQRRAAQAKIFSDPPPLQSAIANDNQPDETLAAIKSVVASQLLASVPENPEDGELADEWAQATYAAFQAKPPLELMRNLRVELLSGEHGEPFAVAASPMRLTELGAAANRSGFGPSTCRQILDYLRRGNLGTSAPDIGADLLLNFGACDEQNNYLLRDIANQKRTRFYFKAGDLDSVAHGWLDGKPLIDMFAALPKAVSSKAAITPAQWVSGEHEYEIIAAQYDKFVDVVEYAFGGFLPWLLRAVHVLAPFGSLKASEVDWARLAELFESSRIVDDLILDEAGSLAVSSD